MGEELKVSAYAISIAGQEQNLDNIFVNGRYLTSTGEDERSVINKVAHADFQVYGVCDGQVTGGEATEDQVFPAAVAMQRLQRLQANMAEENRIDKDQIWDFLVDTNRKMKEYKQATGATEAYASFAALFLHGNRGLAVHLGDSRIYVIRGGRMLQITEDHLQAMELYKYGVITQKQAEVHKRDSKLTACFGMEDIYDAEDSVFSKYFVFYPDDLFLIVSDGVTDNLSNEELERLVRNMKDASAEDVAQELISRVNKLSDDDKSIVVLRIEDAPGTGAPQRGTSAMPQRENFDREEPEEPQVPTSDTTKLSSITASVNEQEDDLDDDYDEGPTLIDKLLGNPKRLAIILGGLLAAIILIVLIANAVSKRGGSKSDSSSTPLITSEETTESSDESVITPDQSESIETSDSSEISAESESTDSETSDSEDSESSEESESTQTSPTESSTYTVQAGDTLYGIVMGHYNFYSEELINALANYNNINANSLSVGQELTLPTLAEMGLE